MSTDTGDISLAVNTALHRGFLRTANRRCPYFIGAVPGNMSKNQSTNVMTWEAIANLATATSALSEVTASAHGMGRTPVVPTVTTKTATMAKFGNFIAFSEEMDLFHMNARSVAFMERLGENAGATLNEKQRDVLDAITTNRWSGGGTTTATTQDSLDANDVRVGVRELARNSALKFKPMATGDLKTGTSPIRDAYCGICHVDNSLDIRQFSGFINVEQYGGYTDTWDGEIGYAEGVRWVETETAPVVDNGGTTSTANMVGDSDILNDVYSVFILGREAHGTVGLEATYDDEIYMADDSRDPVMLIRKAVGSSGVADPLDEMGSVGWKAWWAGVVLDTNFIYKIETLASEPV